MNKGLLSRLGALVRRQERAEPKARPSLRVATRAADIAALIVGVALVAKVSLSRVIILGRIDPVGGLLADVCAVAMIVVTVWLVGRRRGWRVPLYAADGLLTFAMIANSVWAAYHGDVMSPKSAVFANQVGETGNSVRDLLTWAMLAYFIEVVPVIALEWRARTGRLARINGPRRRLRRTGIAVSAILIATAGFASSTLAVANHVGPLNGIILSGERGIFAYQVGSVFHQEGALAEDALEDADTPDERVGAILDAIDEAVGGREGPRLGGVESGSAKGANVIVVQFEALQSFVIGAEIDGHRITPNLDELAEEAWFFRYGTAQIAAGTTVDAEFAANTSCYPAAGQAASVAYVDRELTSLPRTLSAAGYQTVTMHTNTARFWNRRQFYPALGFDRYLDEEFFGTKDTIGWAASDEVLYREGLEEMLRMRDEGAPFYANLITVTSHHPYLPLPSRKDPYQPPAPYAGTSVGAYLSLVEYADRAFGEFVDDLKSSGLWDESIVVVYGDHHAFKTNLDAEEDEALTALLGRESTPLDRMGVPLFVHVPGRDDGHRVETVVGQIDVMPTVLDLLGIEATGTAMFGRSVFVDSPVVMGVRGYGLAGALIDETTLVAPPLTGEEPRAYDFASPLPWHPPTPGQLDKLDEAQLLLELSDVYVRGLPERGEHAEDPEAIMLEPSDE